MKKHLYDEIAKRWIRPNGNAVYVISDPHFNDADAQKFREGYPGDDEFVRMINKCVGKNDTILFLGDIGDESYIKKIRGYKVLVLGNHDKGASNYLKKKVCERAEIDIDTLPKEKANALRAAQQKALSHPLLLSLFGQYLHDYFKKDVFENDGLFDEVYEGPLMINDRVILSHEPMDIPDYMFNIYGHDHSGAYIDDRHLNVCAEVIGYYPINLLKLLDGGILKDVPSIHKVAIEAAVDRKAKREKGKSGNE